MSHHYNYADQELASWFWWWFRREKNIYLRDLKRPLTDELSTDEKAFIWQRVATIAAGKFVGESDERLMNVLERTIKAVEEMPQPWIIKQGSPRS